MKAIWRGSLSFGLINVPINVYPASEERTLDFHMLHKKDLSPIRFARICKQDLEEIPFKDIVKGYEYKKGEYIVIDEKDFEAASKKKSGTIEIEYFTHQQEIDPIYFERPYFLEPDKKAGKAYNLLLEALAHSKKVAVCRFVFRNKEHLGAILPSDEGLLLIQMRYHAEIRSSTDLTISKEKSNSKELNMAVSLIDQLTRHFDPKKHHDTYTEDLINVIEKKLKGKKIPTVKKSTPTYQARDLMGLLTSSLKKASGDKEKKETEVKKAPKKKVAKRKRA